MEDDGRFQALNHFPDFVCCYFTDEEFEMIAPNIRSYLHSAPLFSPPYVNTVQNPHKWDDIY